ncbi:SUMF1/EgtB/PvdO family nonheme iron enzyme [Aeoliella sp.]|uniref:SUMF1/EgtB/PvdO family nonheme iron enzyme n=1 Tax=Aeoliella sp. TaxID=2795800 RepID=UPI003CCBB302
MGNPGNLADPVTGLGSVDYTFRISKFETTTSQFAEFLRTKRRQPSVYNRRNTGGIYRDNYGRYRPKLGREDQPADTVAIEDAMRFANWLHNGQGNGDTETGAYDFTKAPPGELPLHRELGAKYWIPSEDEWYKAAYHDAGAGTAGKYFRYATRSDERPYSDNPDSLNTPDNGNVANYYHDDHIDNGYNGGTAVVGLPLEGYPQSAPSPFTNVGAYRESVGPYGTFDQNGNVSELTDTWLDEYDYRARVLRGGSWNYYDALLASDGPHSGAAKGRPHDNEGFRLASVENPTLPISVPKFPEVHTVYPTSAFSIQNPPSGLRIAYGREEGEESLDFSFGFDHPASYWFTQPTLEFDLSNAKLESDVCLSLLFSNRDPSDVFTFQLFAFSGNGKVDSSDYYRTDELVGTYTDSDSEPTTRLDLDVTAVYNRFVQQEADYLSFAIVADWSTDVPWNIFTYPTLEITTIPEPSTQALGLICFLVFAAFGSRAMAASSDNA